MPRRAARQRKIRLGIGTRAIYRICDCWDYVKSNLYSKPCILLFIAVVAIISFLLARALWTPSHVRKAGVEHGPLTPASTPPEDELHRSGSTSTVPTQLESALTTPSGISTSSRRYPRILLWTEPGHRRPVEGRQLPANGELMLRYCSFPLRDAMAEVPIETIPPDCYVARDHSLLSRSDAIVFDASAVPGVIPPTFRASNQVWVFWTHVGSSPTRDLGSMTTDAFNWTMGRRMDADVVIPYGHWIRSERAASRDFAKREHTKNGTALFFTSDCDHEEDMKELREVLEALGGSTVRGCGASDCGWLQMCLSEYADNFHFLFVGDSSSCYEHPLEAIYDAFRYDLLPVYFGHKVLSNLPEHSFVDAFSMLPATPIFEYLNALVMDSELYSNYFKWKEEHVLSRRDDLCYLCDALKNNLERQTTDVLSWWNKTNVCPLNHRINQAHSQPHDVYLL